jgi:hypothetical protein
MKRLQELVRLHRITQYRGGALLGRRSRRRVPAGVVVGPAPARAWPGRRKAVECTRLRTRGQDGLPLNLTLKLRGSYRGIRPDAHPRFACA